MKWNIQTGTSDKEFLKTNYHLKKYNYIYLLDSYIL